MNTLPLSLNRQTASPTPDHNVIVHTDCVCRTNSAAKKCFCNLSNCFICTSFALLVAGMLAASGYYISLLSERGATLPIGLYVAFSIFGILACAFKLHLDNRLHARSQQHYIQV